MRDILFVWKIPSIKNLADFTNRFRIPNKKTFCHTVAEAYQNYRVWSRSKIRLSKRPQDDYTVSIKDFFFATFPDEVKSHYEKTRDSDFNAAIPAKVKKLPEGTKHSEICKAVLSVGQEPSNIPDTDPIKAEYSQKIFGTHRNFRNFNMMQWSLSNVGKCW